MEIQNLEIVLRAVRRSFRHKRIDENGNEILQTYQYFPVNAADIGELLSLYGNSLAGFGFHVLVWRALIGDMSFMVDLVWRSMRRAGLTAEQIRAEQWKFSRSECGALFPGGDIESLALLTREIMIISGFKIPELKPKEQEKKLESEDEAPEVGESRPSAPTNSPMQLPA